MPGGCLVVVAGGCRVVRVEGCQVVTEGGCQEVGVVLQRKKKEERGRMS